VRGLAEAVRLILAVVPDVLNQGRPRINKTPRVIAVQPVENIVMLQNRAEFASIVRPWMRPAARFIVNNVVLIRLKILVSAVTVNYFQAVSVLIMIVMPLIKHSVIITRRRPDNFWQPQLVRQLALPIRKRPAI
jgi:hypothetical protein